MTIGQKIKKFRTEQGLSQKQLASKAGMSEPAIRNYELGNRMPSEKQIEKIAGSLGVSHHALSNPNLDSYHGLMHALFYLEDKYGLSVQKIDNKLYLYFGNNPLDSIVSRINDWHQELAEFDNGNITKEEYDLWRYSYPRIQAERTKKRLDMSRNKPFKENDD